MSDAIEFVFSFRSPYAWLAGRCVLPELRSDLEVRWRPFFPLPSFANFPPPVRAKQHYLVKDVARLVEYYGVGLRWPSADDPNWAAPHCAFLEAESAGKGIPFALEVFEARFGRGENVAEPAVLGRAAEAVGLDSGPIVAASQDEAGQRDLRDAVQRAYDERGIFGVPMLVMPRGTRYWGHDRIEWAIREGRVE